MRTHLPAFLERVIPRVFSAGLTLVLAILTDPHAVGVYSLVTLAFTAIQAATDAAARQVLPRLVGEPDGLVVLRRYQQIVPTASFVLIAGFIGWLWGSGTLTGPGQALELLPFALAPAFTTIGLRSVGVLQCVDRWRVMARGQALAAILSVVLTLPILLATRNLFGPSLQTLLSEALFALFCLRAAHGITLTEIVSSDRKVAKDFVGMSVYSLMGWLQAQAERVLLGAFLGPAALGTYSTASALGRAAGDSLSSSTANIVRAHVARHESAEDIRATSEAVVIRSMALAIGAVAATIVGVAILAPYMGPKWSEAIRIVPILSLTAFPATLSWTGSALQVRAGRAWRALWGPVLGIVMAILIAIAASRSLTVAAYVVVLREVCVATLAFALVRHHAPWRSWAVGVGLAALGCGVTALVLR